MGLSLPTETTTERALARRLGLFDATMIVMGGIVGSGVFINPYVVARVVHTPVLILGAWAMGGLIALAGGFIYAELAARRPHLGGQYAYIREAWHPMVAFLYGWALLLVTQTGGMAAVAVTFSRYFLEITGAPVSDAVVASLTLAALTVINCLGVRSGSTVQNVLMIIKLGRGGRAGVCGAAAQRWTAAGAASGAGPAGVDRFVHGDGRGADAGTVRVWRLADGEFHVG